MVIPPDEASRTGVRTADQAQRTLHATHALESKLRRDGDEYVAEGAVVDLETRTRLREFSGTYSQLTLAAIPSALAGTVSACLRLERTAAPERLAASAAGHYFRGLYFCAGIGGATTKRSPCWRRLHASTHAHHYLGPALPRRRL